MTSADCNIFKARSVQFIPKRISVRRNERYIGALLLVTQLPFKNTFD